MADLLQNNCPNSNERPPVEGQVSSYCTAAAPYVRLFLLLCHLFGTLFLGCGMMLTTNSLRAAASASNASVASVAKTATTATPTSTAASTTGSSTATGSATVSSAAAFATGAASSLTTPAGAAVVALFAAAGFF